MKRRLTFRPGAGFLVLGALVTSLSLEGSGKAGTTPDSAASDVGSLPPEMAARLKLDEAFGRLPLAFEPNVGQFHKDVKFFARGPGYQLFLTKKEAVFVFVRRERHRTEEELRTGDLVPERLRGRKEQDRDRVTETVVRMSLEGVRPGTKIVGEDPLPGKVNYFFGNDPSKWRTDVPTYRRVRFEDVYRGIDLVYYGNQSGRLEYDFVVRPGADPNAIRLTLRGPGTLGRDGNGDLVLKSAAGSIGLDRPVVYQETAEGRVERSGEYALAGGRRVAFRLAEYDRNLPLVIDPVLQWATFLGGSDGAETPLGIHADQSGYLYLTGYTTSVLFPVTPLAYTHPKPALKKAPFITKLTPDASAFVYSTYIGGNGDSVPNGIAVDSLGSVYIAGTTSAQDYPTTPGAYRENFACLFVTKLSQSGGALSYSTFLGHPGGDSIFALAVDAFGAAYVVGETYDGSFPVTAGAFQTSTEWKISQDSSAGFVTKLNGSGTDLAYSTFLYGKTLAGGTGGVSQGVWAVVLDGGRACVAGTTNARDFPTTPSAFQPTFVGTSYSGFVLKLNEAGQAPLIFSTFLQGQNANRLALDPSGDLFVAGPLSLPPTAGDVDTTSPIRLLRLSSDGTAVPAVIRFRADDVAVAPDGSPVVAGGGGSGRLSAWGPRWTRGAGNLSRFTPDLTRMTFNQGFQMDASNGLRVAVDGGAGAFMAGEALLPSLVQDGFEGTPGVVQPAFAGPPNTAEVAIGKVNLPPPVLIDSIAPSIGDGSSPTTVTISGSGFLPGASVFVDQYGYGPRPADVLSVTPTSITARIWPYPYGGGVGVFPAPVWVLNPDETEGTGLLNHGWYGPDAACSNPTASLTGGTTICPGNSATLSVSMTGTPPFTLYWGDGFTQSGIMTLTATRTVTPSATTTYLLSGITDAACARGVGAYATVTVAALSSAISAPSAACTGSSGLSASVPDAGPGATYSWSITNGTITGGAGTRSITFSPGTSGSLQLSVTVAVGSCSSSSSSTIPVSAPPTAAVSGSATICAGQSTNLSVVLTGAPPWTLTWSDGITQSGLASSPATRSVSPFSTTTYSVTALTDATTCGGTSSGSAVVTVNPIPNATITAPPRACQNGTGLAASVPDAGPGATYSWRIGNGTIVGSSTGRSITFTAGPSGTVQLGVTVTSGGCPADGSATVPILVPPTATLTGPSAACAGTNTNLSVALTGPGPWTIRWSDGFVQNAVSSPAVRPVAPTADTTYSLASVTGAGGCPGTVSGSVSISVKPRPSALVTGSGTVCAGEPTSIAINVVATGAWSILWTDGYVQAGTGPGLFARTVTAQTTTTYQIQSITDSACSAPGSGSAVIQIEVPATAAAITAPTPVCAGATGLAATVLTPVPSAEYVWQITNGSLTSGQGTPAVTFTASAAGPMTLTVTVTGFSGCRQSGSLSLDVQPTPAAPVLSAPSSAITGTSGLVAEVPPKPGSTFVWKLDNGTITSGTGTNRITFRAGNPGEAMLHVAERTAAGCVSPETTQAVRVDGVTSVRMVPAAVNVTGVGGAHFTTELALSNPGPSTMTADLLFTPADGGSPVTNRQTLEPGRQIFIPDVVGIVTGASRAPLADGPSGSGSLRITLGNLTYQGFGYAGARTTAPAGAGRAGTAHAAPVVSDSGARAYVYGLRETAADRSNLGFVNAGTSGEITLRVTLFSGARGDDGRTYILPDPVTLGPGQWLQIGSVLARAGFVNGYALVERTAGSSPFFAYAVFNDNSTNDGSWVGGVPATRTPGWQVEPILVETSAFGSELVLTNPSTRPVNANLAYTESLAHPGGRFMGTIVEPLLAGEQRIIPNAVDYLRSRGAPVGPAGRDYSGTLLVRFSAGGTTVDGFAGVRTASPAASGGGYGLFSQALLLTETAAAEGWVFGLKQDAETRSNLGLLNASGNQGTITLAYDVFDGETGQKVATSAPISLGPGQWTQVNAVLKRFGIANGYVRVFRTAGTAGWAAYGVLNDGAVPGAGTGDGSYVPMTLAP